MTLYCTDVYANSFVHIIFYYKVFLLRFLLCPCVFRDTLEKRAFNMDHLVVGIFISKRTNLNIKR